MRFGMNTDHTLDEVGQQFSVTRAFKKISPGGAGRNQS
jgi:hypothetical protein